jgi:hypothetical protein
MMKILGILLFVMTREVFLLQKKPNIVIFMADDMVRSHKIRKSMLK